ncbi:DUF1772 domain-containing protein [Hansschlegelia zhihuaiae]|uniref:DUF1772 domain-containing protein n=2 Tax=Hansschlegelia zhihuaiae TaxID=405005 RepID=A0A4Q0MGX9_9HYPH|nr:DUF1772 domain-containing protein [Hansschlegelia zhihuaiae]
MATLAEVLAFASALGAGLMGGFFYAFSGLVMPALGQRPTREAAAAMQTINVVVLNPLFFVLFFGTALIGLGSAISALALPADKAAVATVAAVVYVAGCVGVTMARNVPLNEELKAASADGPAIEALWRRYLRDWTWWNHMRTIACVLAAAGFMLALA